MNTAVIRETWAHAWSSIEPFKPELDLASVGLLLVTLLSWLPHITSVVTLIWACVRLYETKTVQGWLARRRASRGDLQ